MKKNVLLFSILLSLLFIEKISASTIIDFPDSLMELEYAKTILRNATENGNLSDLIDNSIPTILPFGISKDLNNDNNADVVIMLDSIVFTPQGAYLESYSVLKSPKTNDTVLAFKATNVQFNNAGFMGDARLELIADAHIKIADSTYMTVQKGGTFIEWECNGFKDLGIKCKIDFDRNFIIPENPDGTQDTTGKQVSTQFQTVINSWDNLLVEVSISPFQFTKLDGFGFYVSNAVFDFSETLNSANIVFPANYLTPSMPEPYSPFWQGFFLKEFQVKLPSEFKNKNSTDRITLQASNVLIDELGFTASLAAYNLLNIDNGSAGGWAFSLDTININIKTNTFVNAKLAGNILLPITDQQNTLHYSGFIDNNGNYFLNVKMKDTLNVSMWAAKLKLLPNSGVSLTQQNHQFIAAANLNGQIFISIDGDAPADIAGIDFQGFKLQTVQPYIDIEHIGFVGNSQNKFSNFPISIYGISFVKQEQDIGISFNVAVNFTTDSTGINANGGFTIIAERNYNSDFFAWKFKQFQINSLAIDIDAGAYKLRGSLIVFRQDPIFGNGFKGNIEATFVPAFSVAVSGQFGNINGLRYWYADALLTLPVGVPILQTGFGLYGFGGGAYYHMHRLNAENVQIPTDPANNPTDNSNNAGQSLSGILYVPDANTFLGIKASVIIGTYPAPDAFNSKSTFEIAFNNNGGVNYIGFQGDAYFMTPILERGNNSKLYATTDIGYDFTNHVLHGVTSVFVNMPPMIEGANANHLAGTSVLHFEPSKWYITIGTPNQRAGLKILNTFNLSSYFMMGTTIPDLPAPPSNVTSIISQVNRTPDQTDLNSGSGFIFGASLSAHLDASYWYFYGIFDAGIGFDLMLKNYGINTHCSGSNDPIGVNGWYAQGQAYAYLSGKIGLNIDEGIFKGKYEIMNLQAAALMQAKLPNPLWMQGDIAGNYSILNGLIKGTVNYKFTLGEQCTIVAGNGLSGIKVIAEVSPAANTNDVDVFNNPQIAFTMKIGETFSFVDVNNNTKTYRISLDYFKIKNNNLDIAGSLKWSADNKVVVFRPTDILPGQSNISLSVKVHFEEFVNNVWINVLANGQPVVETKELSFKTGTAPDYIPENNVLYSYPVNRQVNFYKNEVNYGFIQLTQGQDYLFLPNADWIPKLRFLYANNSIDINYSYDNDSNRVKFEIPNITNSQIYNLVLVNIPAKASDSIAKNVKDLNIAVNDTNTGNIVNIQSKKIEGTYTNLIEKTLYSYYFRTSNYNTFVDKMNAMQLSAPWSWVILNGVHEIGIGLEGQEYFDKFEMQGGNGFGNLIQIYTDNNNTWFNNHTNPLIYCPLLHNNCSSDFPTNVAIDWRNATILGLPPVKTSNLTLYPQSFPEITDQNISNNSFNFTTSFANITNVMDYYQYKDYENLVNIAANHPNRTTNQALINLVTSTYPSMLAGYPDYLYYTVIVKYYIPGSTAPSSSKTIQIGY